MRTRISENSPCRLKKAELRRVPHNPKSWVIGYHVCCPRCGFVSLAMNGQRDLVIDEDMAGQVTFSKPFRCTYCAVRIHLNRCELTLEEDDHVRPLRYK